MAEEQPKPKGVKTRTQRPSLHFHPDPDRLQRNIRKVVQAQLAQPDTPSSIPGPSRLDTLFSKKRKSLAKAQSQNPSNLEVQSTKKHIKVTFDINSPIAHILDPS